MPSNPAFKPFVLAALSAVVTAGFAAPAAAGGKYSPHCNCVPYQHVQVMHAYQPVTYYVPQKVYVPMRVLVPKHARVSARFYLVDQGPSFDMPGLPYTRPTVLYTAKRAYPYGTSYVPAAKRHHAHRGKRPGRAAYRYAPAYGK